MTDGNDNAPKRMSSTKKAELTNAAARDIIHAERTLNTRKIERLKALRLQQEALNPPAPEKPAARKSKTRKI